MAAFFPLISEILPMIIPASTRIVRANEIQRPGVVAQPTPLPAIVDTCDKICASGRFTAFGLILLKLKMCVVSYAWLSVLTLPPNTATSIRHNSEQDAIVFVVRGTARLLTYDTEKEGPARHQLGPGDFAFIPAWTEYRAENGSDLEARWVIFQGGPRPVGAELQDWGGDEVIAHK